TSRSASIGTRLSAGPSAATIAAKATTAAPTPSSGERQPRTTPSASTIVRASTISTALARNAPRNRRTPVILAKTMAASARFPQHPGGNIRYALLCDDTPSERLHRDRSAPSGRALPAPSRGVARASAGGRAAARAGGLGAPGHAGLPARGGAGGQAGRT